IFMDCGSSRPQTGDATWSTAWRAELAMIPRDVKSPTAAIPFHKLLKIVAIVDDKDPQTKKLIEYIEAENFEVDVTDSLARDVAEDTAVGAYIALVDGD